MIDNIINGFLVVVGLALAYGLLELFGYCIRAMDTEDDHE
jgi:hypothetical protein